MMKNVKVVTSSQMSMAASISLLSFLCVQNIAYLDMWISTLFISASRHVSAITWHIFWLHAEICVSSKIHVICVLWCIISDVCGCLEILGLFSIRASHPFDSIGVDHVPACILITANHLPTLFRLSYLISFLFATPVTPILFRVLLNEHTTKSLQLISIAFQFVC